MILPYSRLLFNGILLFAIVFPTLNLSAQTVAERTMPSDPYVPGVTFLVIIKVSSASGAISVVETPPAGWIISRIGNSGQTSGGVITWDLTLSTESVGLRYSVTPPSTANGDAVFSGKIGDMEIGGVTTLTAAIIPFRFGTATNLGTIINSKYDDEVPCVSMDGLEIYFVSNRPGGSGLHDLWLATRASASDDWSAPVNLGAVVNSKNEDSDPSISADGLTLFFASDRAGGYGGLDIWVCTRKTQGDLWGPPKNLGPTVNYNSVDASPEIYADGLSLFFVTDWAGGKALGSDCFVTRRANVDADWLPPENLGLMANSGSGSDEINLSISMDGLILFFDSNWPYGFGSFDIYVTTRETTDAPWSVPVNLGAALNTRFGEVAPFFSGDSRLLYFCDSFVPQPGGFGGSYLWKVTVESVFPSGVKDWHFYK